MQAIARRAAAPVFALALFSSAALIFTLQPLFGRMVTPLLGGSPAVWNTSMAFFQAALLAGYLYAHLLARVKNLGAQAAIHAVVLVAAWLVLPVQVSGALGPPSSEHPALWLLGVLTLSVGAPFAAASATAPLLQAWFARTGRADAHDPYYLYAASNLGSFIGLLAYPILVEPLLGAHAQSAAWSVGYVVVAALIALAGAAALGAHGNERAAEHDALVSSGISWRQRGYWMAAAAVPSALVLGVTLHISTDVASAPMLWVIPLALYLATFVFAFMRGSESIAPFTLFVHPIALAFLVASYFASTNWIASIGGILTGFFFSALVCHLALARTRPSADKLTEFYLFVSLGGVLGGAFAALLAPIIFNNVYEYPLALAAACLFRPRAPDMMPRLADASAASSLTMAGVAVLLLFYSPFSAVAVAGVIGSAAALVAAGWSEDVRPAPMRYAFMAISGLVAGVLVFVAFNIDSLLVSAGDDIADRSVLRQPWGLTLAAAGFLALSFCVHGTLQPRRAQRDANDQVIPDRSWHIADYATGVAIPAMVLAVFLGIAADKVDARVLTVLGLAACAIAIFLNRGRPLVLVALVLSAFVIIFLDDSRGGRIITQERSFFGVLRTRVIEDRDDPEVPPLRVLLHGTTIHGAQLAAPGLTQQPLTYYHPRNRARGSDPGGPRLGRSLEHGADRPRRGLKRLPDAPDRHTDDLRDRSGRRAPLGAPRRRLHLRPECQPNARIELGDARLQIAEERDGAYDVIVVDAFSSDAIPAHLLTREAIALYLSKTSERGIVVLHLSNRNLALVSESARVARDLQAPTLLSRQRPLRAALRQFLWRARRQCDDRRALT